MTKACAAADPLEKCLASAATKRLTAGMIAQLIKGLNSDKAMARITDWDAATQRFLALVPLDQSRQALGQPLDPKVRDELDALRKSLEFAPGYDSPRGFDPAATPAQPKK